jgi:hypothetical protein
MITAPWTDAKHAFPQPGPLSLSGFLVQLSSKMTARQGSPWPTPQGRHVIQPNADMQYLL